LYFKIGSNADTLIGVRLIRGKTILSQLNKYYGEQVNNYIHYEEKVWALDPMTYTNYDQHILPHQNNGAAIFQKPFFDNRFFIAGSETSREYPGYMDGAIRSAKFISQLLSSSGKVS